MYSNIKTKKNRIFAIKDIFSLILHSFRPCLHYSWRLSCEVHQITNLCEKICESIGNTIDGIGRVFFIDDMSLTKVQKSASNRTSVILNNAFIIAMFASPKMVILNPDWTRIIDLINEIIPIIMAICEHSEFVADNTVYRMGNSLLDYALSICYIFHCTSNILAIFCWQNIITVRVYFLSGKGFPNWWLYYNNDSRRIYYFLYRSF